MLTKKQNDTKDVHENVSMQDKKKKINAKFGLSLRKASSVVFKAKIFISEVPQGKKLE